MFSFLYSFLGFKDRRKHPGEKHNNRPRNVDEGDKTIIDFSSNVLRNVVPALDAERQMDEPEIEVQQQNYKIRLAHSKGSFDSASMLVQRMYIQKGYDIPGMHKMPDRITLTASQNGSVSGTITLGIDTGNGLLADENYKQEVDQLRAEGRRVCELTKFAVEHIRDSKRVLAALFNVAYIYGRMLQRQTDVIIEVTPKHAKFYKRMLGFEQIGPERVNSRVNTVGVLLRLEIDYVDRQIQHWGGTTDQAHGERSLYPYFFSKEDVEGITQRLLHGA